MGAFSNWFTSVVLVIGAAIVFNHLGINLSPVIGTTLHGIERALGTPLSLW